MLISNSLWGGFVKESIYVTFFQGREKFLQRGRGPGVGATIVLKNKENKKDTIFLKKSPWLHFQTPMSIYPSP